MKQGLIFVSLLIVAAIIALLSLNSVKSVSQVTGKDEETGQTTTQYVQQSVDNFNKAEQQRIEDAYNIYD